MSSSEIEFGGTTDRIHLGKTILLKGEVQVFLMIYIRTYLKMFYYILPTSLSCSDTQSLVVGKLQFESAYLMFHGAAFIFMVIVIAELMLASGKGFPAHPGSPPAFFLGTQHIKFLVTVDQGCHII